MSTVPTVRPVMLITGGSRGIGRATSVRAAAQGWDVAFSYQSDTSAAEATCAAIAAQGRQALAVRSDASVSGEVKDLFARTVARFDRLDAVVANAGIVGPSMRLSEMDDARLRQMIDINLLGALYTAREAARVLPRFGKGALIFVSSAAARLGSANEYVDYAATKGAVDTLTLGLSRELAADNIRVNAVRPGLIATDIHASGGQPDRAARLGAQVPMGRPGTAEEVAEAIVWLCSPAAAYVTGTHLDVAGGR